MTHLGGSSGPRASLFVATYEMPKHLALVCEGLKRQSTQDFEVLFCDDGSGEETRRVIDTFWATFGKRGQHLWQPHEGFRKCRILNAAARVARGEVFVFLDGDCVPHRQFIEDHLNQQEEGYYLAGRRVELGEAFSQTLTPEAIAAGVLDKPSVRLLWDGLRGRSQAVNRSFRWVNPVLRRALKLDRIVDLKGCNYSIPRSVLTEINGFDEAYEGYGREDTDVELRLQHLGLRIKSLKGLALQFHVWHPRRDFTPANDNRLEVLKASKRIRCEKGLVDSRSI